MIRKVMLFLALVCSVAAAIDNCQKAGGYCLNHWDCCSNTCLNYLYKCSNVQSQSSAGGVVQSAPAVFAPAAVPTISPDALSFDALLEIVFRPLIFTPKNGRELNAIESRFGEDILTEYETTTIPTTINPTDYPTTNGPPQCLEIGSKCYRNDECCTERCHGFLHQCVT